VPRLRRGTFACVGGCGEEKGFGGKESPQPPPFSLARPLDGLAQELFERNLIFKVTGAHKLTKFKS